MKARIKLRVQNQLARVMDENHINVVKKYFFCQTCCESAKLILYD